MITQENISDLFLARAVEHRKAISIGDYQKANVIHKELQDIYSFAKENGNLDVFEGLINVENDCVRLWAATFTLKNSPAIAEKTLLQLTILKNVTGLAAKTTLELWKKGLLNMF